MFFFYRDKFISLSQTYSSVLHFADINDFPHDYTQLRKIYTVSESLMYWKCVTDFRLNSR